MSFETRKEFRDDNDLGSFTTLAALQADYPTASNGDFAFTRDSDALYTWDSDTADWVSVTSGASTLQQAFDNGQSITINDVSKKLTIENNVNSASNVTTLELLA